MPKLILSMDGLVLKEIELTKERISIGRKPHNDIQIDNLAISGEHAVITTILKDAFLEDQNSTNGTYVNGQPVKKHVLQNNDLVELGKYRLKFIADSAAPAVNPSEFIETAALKPLNLNPAGDLIETQVLGSSAASRDQVATQILEPGPSTSEPAVGGEGMLQVLNGSNTGRELPLTKSLTTIGKPGVQVAVITRRPHGYYITHVEGTTFPSVNGKTLDAQAHRLNDQDVISIAGVKMSFFLR